jgi:hypothetical protein
MAKRMPIHPFIKNNHKAYEKHEKDQLVERRTRSGTRPCGRPVRGRSRNNDVNKLVFFILVFFIDFTILLHD